MLTLALDTTAEFGSIALLCDREVLSEVVLHAPDGFSGILFAEIDSILAKHDTKLAGVDLFAAASGPGSFTGVRIGLAAIKGLAEVMGKPAVPVSNLEALSRFGHRPLRATLIDARRGEVFGALYSEAGAVIDEQVITFPRFLELLADRDFEWVCSDFEAFLPTLAGTRFEALPRTIAPPAIAAMVGQIAIERLSAGASGEPATIEANYVRRSDAELLWREPAR
ncbi:MAG: peptidase glycoprotease [Bryobacterales bacterium]|nr:peptidase glycoprotease [Bryobacterales bacterium]